MPLKPDPTFYPSPASAAEAPGREAGLRRHAQHGHRTATGAPTRSPSSTSTPARRRYGTVDRPARHAERRRRAAPLRLERLLARAVPVGAAPARRAPLPARARACARRASTSSTSRPTRSTRSSSRTIEPEELHHRTGYSRPHTIHCGPDGIYVSRARQPRRRRPRRHLPARPRRLRVRAGAGRSTAARSTWPTTSGGTSATTRCSPASGARRTWSRTASTPSCCSANQYGHQLHVWDLRRRRHVQAIDLGARAPDGARAAPGPRPDARPTASSASSSRRPTCRASVWLWHRQDDGSVGVEKVITIPAEPAEPDQLPPR